MDQSQSIIYFLEIKEITFESNDLASQVEGLTAAMQKVAEEADLKLVSFGIFFFSSIPHIPEQELNLQLLILQNENSEEVLEAQKMILQYEHDNNILQSSVSQLQGSQKDLQESLVLSQRQVRKRPGIFF